MRRGCWTLGMLMVIVLHQALLCRKPTEITTNRIWAHDWYLEAEWLKIRLKGAPTCSYTTATSSSVNLQSIISGTEECLGRLPDADMRAELGINGGLSEPHQYNDLTPVRGSYSNDRCFENSTSGSLQLPRIGFNEAKAQLCSPHCWLEAFMSSDVISIKRKDQRKDELKRQTGDFVDLAAVSLLPQPSGRAALMLHWWPAPQSMEPEGNRGVPDASDGNLAWLADIDRWFCEPRTGLQSRRGRNVPSVHTSGAHHPNRQCL